MKSQRPLPRSHRGYRKVTRATRLYINATGLLTTAEQPEPLVRRVLAPNPSPYTYTGTQTYLVGAEREIAVIDPGPNKPDHVAALIAAIGDAKVIAIMCTHTHNDHSPAAKPLAMATGAPVVGCAPLVLEVDGPRSDEAFDTTYEPDRVLEDEAIPHA